jgi:hypothetical protein
MLSLAFALHNIYYRTYISSDDDRLMPNGPVRSATLLKSCCSPSQTPFTLAKNPHTTAARHTRDPQPRRKTWAQMLSVVGIAGGGSGDSGLKFSMANDQGLSAPIFSTARAIQPTQIFGHRLQASMLEHGQPPADP